MAHLYIFFYPKAILFLFATVGITPTNFFQRQENPPYFFLPRTRASFQTCAVNSNILTLRQLNKTSERAERQRRDTI